VSFTQRVMSQSFQYDWLGNTKSTDDDAHGFYDRSLGTITNGTATAGPYQLGAAHGAAASARGGALSATYDAAGNLVSLSVTRAGPCLPATASCSQQFAYDWDEVGRLVTAKRWDSATATGTPNAELDYAYDGSDNRTLKTAVGAGEGGADAQTVYVFGSLELRRTTWSATDYALHDADDNPTEVAYLYAHGVRLARLHYAIDSVPSFSTCPTIWGRRASSSTRARARWWRRRRTCRMAATSLATGRLGGQASERTTALRGRSRTSSWGFSTSASGFCVRVWVGGCLPIH
jgi:hypothetical protein